MRPTSLHAAIVWTLLAALCGLCVVQWLREATLTKRIESLDAEVSWHKAETADRQAQLSTWESEIESLSKQLAEANAGAGEREAEWLAERQQLTAELEQARSRALAVEQATGRITLANETIQNQADRIRDLTERLERQQADMLALQEQRDDLARQLNERIEAYNVLVQRLGDS